MTLLHKARESYRVAMCRNFCSKLTVFNLANCLAVPYLVVSLFFTILPRIFGAGH